MKVQARIDSRVFDHDRLPSSCARPVDPLPASTTRGSSFPATGPATPGWTPGRRTGIRTTGQLFSLNPTTLTPYTCDQLYVAAIRADWEA
jgi:hypothetical protein